jgi:hypothetical protein
MRDGGATPGMLAGEFLHFNFVVETRTTIHYDIFVSGAGLTQP